MVILGLYIIALTFVGMAIELFHLANMPTQLDLRLRTNGPVFEYEARALAQLHLRRVAALLSGSFLLIVGTSLVYLATSSWL